MLNPGKSDLGYWVYFLLLDLNVRADQLHHIRGHCVYCLILDLNVRADQLRHMEVTVFADFRFEC